MSISAARFVVSAMLVLLPDLSGAEPLTASRAVDYRRISDLRFSPDGARLVCVVAEAGSPIRQAHLWSLRLGKEELHQLTFSQKVERAPKWGPGQAGLAFISNRDGIAQVYLLASDAAQPHAITASATEVSDFQWSPDGKTIAYLAAEQKSQPENSDHDEKVASQALDLYQLWLVDLRTGSSRRLVQGSWRFHEFRWYSNAGILARASDQPSSQRQTDALYTVSVQDGGVTLFGRPALPFRGLEMAADRRHFGFLSTDAAGPEAHDLFVQSFGEAQAVDVSKTIDRNISDIRWQDGNTIYVSATSGFYKRVFRIDGHHVPQQIELPHSLSVNSGAFDVATDGTLAFIGAGFARLPEIYIRRTDRSVIQVSHIQQGWESIDLLEPQPLRFKSFDGTDIEAMLFTPPTRQASSRLPLVLLVHGGPAGAFSADYYWFNAWAQLLATNGFQVLLVNPRGSTGYGEKFLQSNRRDWGGGDFKDLMAAVDVVVARGHTDPHRIGIGGWSYGGEMALWAITQTQRFAAAVAGAPVFDQAAEFESEDGPYPDEWYLGTPSENPEIFAKTSPSQFVKNAKTPTLILIGADDDTNPASQAWGAYWALQYFGVETELIQYPGEGHIPQKPKHQIDALVRMLDWFQRHLLGSPLR